MAKTKGGSNARPSESSSSTRRSKRLKQSEIPVADIVEHVTEYQVDESFPVNSSHVHDASDPDASKVQLVYTSKYMFN